MERYIGTARKATGMKEVLPNNVSTLAAMQQAFGHVAERLGGQLDGIKWPDQSRRYAFA